MRRFSAAQYMRFAEMGSNASAALAINRIASPRGRGAEIDEDKTVAHVAACKFLEKEWVELELISSLATVRRLLKLLEKPNTFNNELNEPLLELQGRLVDETEARTFWALSVRESELYRGPRKGWELIIERFPDTVIDIEEASKCLALSRYAGAIFHSVQVVEVGLIELGKLIGVSDPKSGWTATTNRLVSIIKKGHDARTPYERQHFPFLEQMHGTIEGPKNAWRNKISHAQGRLALLTADFSPDVAEEILLATRAFMRRLATDAPPLDEAQRALVE